MKLSTLIDGRQRKGKAECKNRNSVISNDRVISLSNFCNCKLVRSIPLKVLKINK